MKKNIKINKVLVTGADGMLGSYICRELIKQKYELCVLVQKERNTGTLTGLPLEMLKGDILDIRSLETALTGCDAVIHAAASTQIWPSRSTAVWQVNYYAVKILAELVLKLGTKKLVHIGTANSFGPGSKENPGTETNEYTDYKYKLDYQDSKRAAQEYLLDEFKLNSLPVTIINPGFMFGAYDSKPGSGQMILSVYNNKTPGYTSGGKSYIAAKDVAVGAVNALKKGRNGECYIAANENLNYQEAFNLIADTLAVRRPKLKIPSFIADIYGLQSSFLGTVFNKIPKMSFPMARLSHADCYYSNNKAVDELGLPQTPIKAAILEAFEWFKANGYI